ncbi:MAG: TIGR02206 family membrane protein [Fusobacterium sp.]|uniref:YwaF family protein n=1 Tax=Fusobacterium sp. TaxID=68766 RepID=UPI0026DDA93E|nr:TIGR02206 family membrane protein [Fusobacterium sp.]MDO4690039.1 TIGR02206 family membrane protein [Fusobacterium sp.]
MDKFILFGNAHLITIAVGFAVSLLFIFLGFIVRKDSLAKFLAVVVLGIKVAELIYRHHYFEEKFIDLLPLHLCNLTIILAGIMMLTTSKAVFQPLYFWGIGALFAIITPELKEGMRDFASISFFITHFFIIFSIAYGIIHFNFRVTKAGAIGSFIFLNLVAFGLYFLNERLGTNYLYVNRPPSSASPVDFFGPWPYYIFSVEGIYIALSFILYLPFREKKTKYIR